MTGIAYKEKKIFCLHVLNLLQSFLGSIRQRIEYMSIAEISECATVPATDVLAVLRLQETQSRQRRQGQPITPTPAQLQTARTLLKKVKSFIIMPYYFFLLTVLF